MRGMCDALVAEAKERRTRGPKVTVCLSVDRLRGGRSCPPSEQVARSTSNDEWAGGRTHRRRAVQAPFQLYASLAKSHNSIPLWAAMGARSRCGPARARQSSAPSVPPNASDGACERSRHPQDRMLRQGDDGVAMRKRVKPSISAYTS